ncbi:MAG: HlyD family secretion protein, partial [Clostridium sp.]
MFNRDTKFITREFLYSKQVKFNILISTILIIVVSTLILSLCFVKKEVYFKASGKISNVPNAEQYVSMYTSKVKELFVKDGQPVKKGDKILSLETSEVNAEYDKLKTQEKILVEQIAGFEKLLICIKNGKNTMSEESETIYYHLYEDYMKQKSTHSIEDKRNQFQVEILKEKVNEDKLYLKSIEEVKNLCEDGSSNYYRTQQFLDEINCLEDDVDKTKRINSEKQVLLSAIKDSEQTLQLYDLDKHEDNDVNFVKEINTKLSEAKSQLEVLSYDVKKYSDVISNLNVTSEDDGIVSFKKPLSIGQAVNAGDNLIEILDGSNDNIFIEFYIPSDQIGKVQEGQKVTIDFFASNQYYFKAIESTIVNISNQPTTITSNDTVQSIYICQTVIDRSKITNEEGDLEIAMGMNVNCNVIQ